MIGRTMGRYRVVEQLGQGGMGVVYKARDTVLDRFVALKLLPPDKSADPDRRQRFLQEAKAASALNHPGIVTVHDVLQVDGQDVLVMELVDGETLEGLLARQLLPVGRALGLAVSVADALARAHAAGIVHRDLKPSNVMVTSEGVKVMDFGLAKLAATPFHDPEAPTVGPGEHALTRERVILGTVPWMSPEQASGDPVDARSDIFSFGVLLYEMLTGHHPFRRATTSETLDAIRSSDPRPPTEVSPTLPPEVDRAVLRCLRKDPGTRWQSLSDLAAVLADLKEDSESGRRVVTDNGTERRRAGWLWASLAGVAVISALAAAALWLLRTPPPDSAPLEIRRLTYDGGFSGTPTISPDGNLIAYASDRLGDGQNDIWVRHVNQPEPARLTSDPADDMLPSFSPDGSQIAFRSERAGGGIYVVNTFGGEPRKIVSGGTFPRFSPDGSLILYMESPVRSPTGLLRMFVVPAEGGEPRVVIPEFGALQPPGSIGPLWSPDGGRLLFAGAPFADPAKRDWWVAPMDGGEPVSSGATASLPRIDIVQTPCGWFQDRVLFIAGTTIEGVNLYSAPISPEGHIDGPPRTLTSGPGVMWTPSVSADARVAFSKMHWVVRLWELDLDPRTGRALGTPSRITSDASPKFSFSLSRDGALLAYSDYSGPRDRRYAEVRLRHLDDGREAVAVTSEARLLSLEPRLSPDGSTLAWNDIVDRQRTAFVAPVSDPMGREVCRGCVILGFFADGNDVLIWRAPNRLARIHLNDASETLLLDLADREILDADLSSDDRWLAFSSAAATDGTTIHVAPVGNGPAAPSEWIAAVDGPAWLASPRFSPDQRFLYFLSDRDDFNCVWAQPLDPVSARPAGEPFAVLHAHRNDMKMTTPGKRAYLLVVAGHRMVFNASETTGEVYTARLPPS